MSERASRGEAVTDRRLQNSGGVLTDGQPAAVSYPSRLPGYLPLEEGPLVPLLISS